MKARYSHLIPSDLANLHAYIAHDNPERAASFVKELLQKCAALSHNPFIYPVRLEFGTGVRMALLKSYRIFFIVEEENQCVHILRILHSARNTQSLL